MAPGLNHKINFEDKFMLHLHSSILIGFFVKTEGLNK